MTISGELSRAKLATSVPGPLGVLVVGYAD
jgi:hypothetical protein